MRNEVSAAARSALQSACSAAFLKQQPSTRAVQLLAPFFAAPVTPSSLQVADEKRKGQLPPCPSRENICRLVLAPIANKDPLRPDSVGGWSLQVAKARTSHYLFTAVMVALGETSEGEEVVDEVDSHTGALTASKQKSYNFSSTSTTWTTGPDPFLQSIGKPKADASSASSSASSAVGGPLPDVLEQAKVPNHAQVTRASHILPLIRECLSEDLCNLVVYPDGKRVLGAKAALGERPPPPPRPQPPASAPVAPAPAHGDFHSFLFEKFKSGEITAAEFRDLAGSGSQGQGTTSSGASGGGAGSSASGGRGSS